MTLSLELETFGGKPSSRKTVIFSLHTKTINSPPDYISLAASFHAVQNLIFFLLSSYEKVIMCQLCVSMCHTQTSLVNLVFHYFCR